MPRISIIIPVYKSKETIAACLDSVTAQTRTGKPVAPSKFGQAAKRIAPAGAT